MPFYMTQLEVKVAMESVMLFHCTVHFTLARGNCSSADSSGCLLPVQSLSESSQIKLPRTILCLQRDVRLRVVVTFLLQQFDKFGAYLSSDT